MRKAALYAVPLGVAVVAAAACSSTPKTSTGIETITGTTANPNPVTLNVKASGPYSGSGHFRLPRGSAPAIVHLVFPGGTLVAHAGKSVNQTPKMTGHCVFSQQSGGVYTIAPDLSTSLFKGATGHGHFHATFAGTLPTIAKGAKKGQCNTSNSAEPLPGSSRITVTITGPLTIK